MAVKLKAIYYINQFYAGIGGEERADAGLTMFDGVRGPAIGVAKFWKDEMEVVKTIACGDNFVNTESNFPEIASAIRELVDQVKPDVFIAGPAFNAGRYGVGCARVCDYVRHELDVSSVTAMHPENPAVSMYVKNNLIVATPETAAGMSKILPRLAALALKLARGEKVGPAAVEGYIPTGHRYNELHEKTGAQRVVEMLLAKLGGQPVATEIPIRTFESAPAAPPIADLGSTLVALVTTGGLVPKGNPDGLRQAFSTTYGSYSIEQLEFIPSGDYESIHGGYDTTIVNDDPNRLAPLDELRSLAALGKIGGVWSRFLTTCGIGTNVVNGVSIGQRMAAELKSAGVGAVILTST